MIRSVFIEIMVATSIRFSARLPTVTPSTCTPGRAHQLTATGRGLEAGSICYPPTASGTSTGPTKPDHQECLYQKSQELAA